MSNPIIFGNDAGMGAGKLAGPDGCVEFVTQAALNGDHKVARMMGLGTTKPPMQVITNAGAFYVGPGAHDWGRPVESLDYERLTGTPEMVALFCGMFTQYIRQRGPLAVPLSVTVGLPLEMMSGDEAVVTANIEAVRRWMKGTHHWTANGEPHQIEVAEIKVTSQTAGALFDYLLNDEGQFIPERRATFRGEVGIISIGFNTVEIQAVRERKTVQKWTGGTTSGVRRLLEMVNVQRLYSRGELDMRLRGGDLDVSNALPVWEREVVGAVEDRWGSQWKRFTAVIIVGGGAKLLKDTLPYRFNGKAFMPDEPVLSIARGLRKLGLLGLTKKRDQSDPTPTETQG